MASPNLPLPILPMAAQLLAVGIGAVLGAWCRFGLGLWLNARGDRFPLGTLVANVVGGLLIGGLLAWAEQSELSAWWRLVLITGFLGALTTFSSFSAEALQLLLKRDFYGALLHSASHLALSLGATALSYSLIKALLGVSPT